MPAGRARVWATVALLLPWAFGLGVAIPATFTLALLWGYLKRGERAVFVGLTALLVASPIALSIFGELSLPMRATSAAVLLHAAHQPGDVFARAPRRADGAGRRASRQRVPRLRRGLDRAEGQALRRGRRGLSPGPGTVAARGADPQQPGQHRDPARQRRRGREPLQAGDRTVAALGRPTLQPRATLHGALPLRRGERGDRPGDGARLRPRAQPAGALVVERASGAGRGVAGAGGAVARGVRRRRGRQERGRRASGVAPVVREPRRFPWRCGRSSSPPWGSPSASCSATTCRPASAATARSTVCRRCATRRRDSVLCADVLGDRRRRQYARVRPPAPVQAPPRDAPPRGLVPPRHRRRRVRATGRSRSTACSWAGCSPWARPWPACLPSAARRRSPTIRASSSTRRVRGRAAGRRRPSPSCTSFPCSRRCRGRATLARTRSSSQSSSGKSRRAHQARRLGASPWPCPEAFASSRSARSCSSSRASARPARCA